MVAQGAGVTGTPLARKLGLREGDRFVLVGAPDPFPVPQLPAGVVTVREPFSTRRRSSTDVLVAFFSHAAQLGPAFDRLGPRICPAGSLWAAWPRRAAGHESDLGDTVVRTAALAIGLVDVKVAALGEDWSGLRFVWRKDLRPPSPTGAPGSSPRRSPS